VLHFAFKKFCFSWKNMIATIFQHVSDNPNVAFWSWMSRDNCRLNFLESVASNNFVQKQRLKTFKATMGYNIFISKTIFCLVVKNAENVAEIQVLSEPHRVPWGRRRMQQFLDPLKQFLKCKVVGSYRNMAASCPVTDVWSV